MKRLFLPFAALAMLATSCDVGTNDSSSTIYFSECNLISNLVDQTQPAQISSSIYTTICYWSKNCVEFSTTDLVINNQKISFETDTMALKTYYLVSEDKQSSIENGVFGSKTNVGMGAEITNLDAMYTPGSYVTNSVFIPGIESLPSFMGYRLVMGYDLNSQYHVQTFWPTSCYIGTSHVVGSETFSTMTTSYRVDLYPSKNTAKVIIYNPQFSSSDKDVPQAIVIDEVPIKFSNKSYSLVAESPKTQVLGSKKDDNGNNVIALVDTDKYNVTDFSFAISSEDLTEATITYRIDGNRVTFSGCSIIKPVK